MLKWTDTLTVLYTVADVTGADVEEIRSRCRTNQVAFSRRLFWFVCWHHCPKASYGEAARHLRADRSSLGIGLKEMPKRMDTYREWWNYYLQICKALEETPIKLKLKPLPPAPPPAKIDVSKIKLAKSETIKTTWPRNTERVLTKPGKWRTRNRNVNRYWEDHADPFSIPDSGRVRTQNTTEI